MVEDDFQNFPVLISHVSSNFIAHAQPDGDDFVFVDENKAVRFAHEIEHYNPATGKL
jgi:hypothetical protein